MSDFKPGRIPDGVQFAIVPNDAALDPDLGPGPFRLYVILCGHADKDGICWPSLKKIAKRLKVCERTVRDWLKALLDAGWVVKSHRKNNTNRYLVIRDPEQRDWARGQTFKDQTKPRLAFSRHAKRGRDARKSSSKKTEENCTPTGVKNSAPKQTRSTNQFIKPIIHPTLEAEQERLNRIAQKVGGLEKSGKPELRRRKAAVSRVRRNPKT